MSIDRFLNKPNFMHCVREGEYLFQIEAPVFFTKEEARIEWVLGFLRFVACLVG